MREDLTDATLKICPLFSPRAFQANAFYYFDKVKKGGGVLHCFCPINFLVYYVKHVATVRYTAVVCMLECKPQSKQRLAHWLCNGLSQACVLADKSPSTPFCVQLYCNLFHLFKKATCVLIIFSIVGKFDKHC